MNCPYCGARMSPGELHSSGDSAVFLPDTTPEAICTGLRCVLEDSSASHQRAARARENALAHFTWDAVFDKLIQSI